MSDVVSFATILPAFAGLFAAAVLSLGHVLDIPVPCGASGGCVTVAAHPSSKFLGLPIAYLGVGFFLIQIGLLSQSRLNRRVEVMRVVLAAAGTVLSAALLLYARWAIHATCAWCVASGAAMAAIFVLGWSSLRSKCPRAGLRPRVAWGLGFVTAVAIGVQAGQMQRAAFAPPVAAERLAAIPATALLEPGKSLGPVNAAVTIIVFADFMCPACRTELGSLVKYQQANPGAVRIVYRHLPLAEIRGHENSPALAALSELAAEQGKFWLFAQAVHSRGGELSRAAVREVMLQLGLDPVRAETRLGDPADPAGARVRRDIDLAEHLGIQATPTFIVQAGAYPPISASPKGLAKVLNSPVVVSLLSAPAQPRLAQH